MNEKKLPYLLLLPSFLLIFFFMIYPFVYSLGISLYAYTIYNPGPFVGAGNYVEAVGNRVFRFSLAQTIYWIALSLTSEFILGLGIAITINRFVRPRRMITSLLIVPLMMTPIVVGLVWRIMYYSEKGVINQVLDLFGLPKVLWFVYAENSIPALAIAEIWEYTPFMILIFLAGLQGVPKELVDAASVDGVSKWGMFRYVTFPCIRPVAVVGVIFSLMRMFKAFDVIAILTQGGPGYVTHLISYYIYKVAWHFSNIGSAAAMSWVLVIIVTSIGVVYIRFMRGYLEL